MLKTISIAEVELGMFIHRLQGSWLSHPFWKSRFVIRDEDDLAALRESEVPAVIIDTQRGADVQAPAAAPPAGAATGSATRVGRALSSARQSLVPAAPPPPAATHASPGTIREFGRARETALHARRTISRTFLEARFGKRIRMGAVEPVIDDIFSSIQRNPHAFNSLMRCKRDNQMLYRHALAVSALMISLARKMKLPPAQIREAGAAGLLLDVGIGLLAYDLDQPSGSFAQIPAEILQAHVQCGHGLLAASGEMPTAVLDACLRHHERLDGSGYPHGLAGEAIDPLSRMAAICDHFDMRVSDPGAPSAVSPALVLEDMQAAPHLFDSKIMAHFAEVIGVYPVGTFVQLVSGRVGMVIDQDTNDTALPTVRIFWSTKLDRPIRRTTLNLAQAYGEDAIESTLEPAGLAIGDIRALRENLLHGSLKA